MANYIVIDGGTTNTRISLVKSGRVIATKKFNVGAKKSINDNEALKQVVKLGIDGLLTEHQIAEEQIEIIIASGMITSEFGLCEVKHIEVPAGVKELARGIKKVWLDEVSKIPFAFIPGVKLGKASLDGSDMMRGEETELVGIFRGGEHLYVLPGSHSKVIQTDNTGRITDFTTMLTGEMLAAVAQNTILSDAVDMTVSQLDKKYLLDGYKYCDENGINKSLFKTRVLKNLFGAKTDEIYSFFMGVTLYGEVSQIIKYRQQSVVVGGRKQLRLAVCELLKKFSDKRVICLDEDEVDKANICGMIIIYEFGKEHKND